MKQDIYVLIEHFQGQIAEISFTMLAAAGGIAGELGCGVVAVLLGNQAQELANDLAANRVLYYDHPELAYFNPGATQRIFADLIQENKPRLALFGDTSTGAEAAGQLSARFNLPLVSYCRSIRVQDGELRFTSQICGGKIMVEGVVASQTVLATMIPGGYRTEQGRASQPPVMIWSDVPAFDPTSIRLKSYITPDLSDVDISKEAILVSVGRGIENQDNIEMVQELADALGGVLCASRPVVDQGWLPSTRLVGKSGKRVKPKLYLGLGISGAPEHVESITDSETIIAINTDPAAPIFNLAQYGATVDLFDLVPLLTDSIKQAKTALKA